MMWISPLPDGWQGINSQEKAISWIYARDVESTVFLVKQVNTEDLIGLLILNENEYTNGGHADLKLGYLLNEIYWGKGFGSELVSGLVNWCKIDGTIRFLTD